MSQDLISNHRVGPSIIYDPIGFVKYRAILVTLGILQNIGYILSTL